MELVLAIDLGGTSLRAGLVDAGGAVQRIAAHPHAIAAEADPQDWWTALRGLIADLRCDKRDIAGIGLCGFTRSQILIDAAGAPVRPAQCFPDGRATAEAAALAGAEAGTWTEMSAWHPLARLRWVQTRDPAAFARARTVLQPKDFLGLRLTGRAATDRIANAWALDRATGLPATAPWRRAGLDPALLPDLLDPQDQLGAVPSGNLAGLPVFTGSMDTWCAAIGAGSVRAGGAYIVSGTTDVAGVFTTAPRMAPGLVTLPWGGGLFHLGGPSQAGADCAGWAATLLGVPDVAALVALAAQADGRGGPLLFLPYLTGERAPLWQPGARGVFLGLHRDHGPPALARAVLEGVAFANRDLLYRAGAPFDALVLCGGGSRSDFWCQIRADVLGVPVQRSAVAEPGLVGAAACAWVGLGRYATLAAAQAAMAGQFQVFTPDPERRRRADALFSHFQRLQAMAVPLAIDLAALGE
jgi:xylulokinase